MRVWTRSLASRFDSGSSMRKTCGLADDRAAHRDALALATGEGLRLAVEVRLEVEDLGGLLDPLADLGLVDAGDLEREAHVVGDRHVRVERVVLEHHRDVAVLGRQVGDVAVADADARRR